MKKFLLSICFMLCLAAIAHAQYIVTKVNGRVKKADGSYVMPGAKLTDNDQLTWSSAKDNIWVIQIGKGEKVITPKPNPGGGQGLLTQLLMASIRQSTTSASLSGRGEIVERIPDALRTNPRSNGLVIIADENKFLFDPKAFPQDAHNFFFAEIDEPRHNPVTRRLQTSGDTLYISSINLSTDTRDAAAKYMLGYHTDNGASRMVVEFKPYFDVTNEADDFIASTVSAYRNGGLAKDAVRDSVYQNLYASSGKPNGIAFTVLFNKYWAGPGPATAKANQGTGGRFDQDAFQKVPKLSGSVIVTRDELPHNFSLIQYAPPVGNQGFTQSCQSWATAYAARSIAYAVRNGYSINNNYDKIVNGTFAPDFVYNNIRTTNDCNSPSYINKALQFMTQKGNVVKKMTTFDCGKYYDNTVLADAQNYRIKDFMRVNDRSLTRQDLILKMKALIASKHALPFGTYFTESMRNIPTSGIWIPTEQDRQNVILANRGQLPYYGHAMCVVGYDDNVNGGSFEIMNSWGIYVGRKGFYWFNYDDFCSFVAEVYTLNDFENPAAAASVQPVLAQVKTTPAASATITPAVTTAPEPVSPPSDELNNAKAIAKVTTTQVSNTTVPIKPINLIPDAPAQLPEIPKPMLKGAMEFMLMKDDNSFESVAVTKNGVNTRGQSVQADDVTNPGTYANFLLSKPFFSGNKYKIKFDLAQPAYVYVVGMDKESNYTLFPQQKLNESALINIDNSTLYLPNDSTHYTLDNVVGREKMCVMVSKSPIDLDAINKQYTAAGDHNLYAAIRKLLSDRLMEAKTGNYLSNKVSFSTEVADESVLAFFIEIEHK